MGGAAAARADPHNNADVEYGLADDDVDYRSAERYDESVSVNMQGRESLTPLSAFNLLALFIYSNTRQTGMLGKA